MVLERRRKSQAVWGQAAFIAMSAFNYTWLSLSGVLRLNARLLVMVGVIGALGSTAFLVRQSVRRTIIGQDGTLTVDGLFTRRRVDLGRLTVVQLRPDKPWYTAPNVPLPIWHPPALVLEDEDGGQVGLIISDHWGPPAPLFRHVLEAVERARPTITEVALAELRFMAGTPTAATDT